ncbi:inositol 1,4,5-trisphosphate receptor-interacting protein-like 1 [Cyrtonyx montezumae]|uniref:inositol 1,4,5-trisphosphate receptor-interacting protein-like 1 n=1 Tax=Cyrtonyx montezumae TaxID=9017 RepID=UPI0032DA011D
MEPLTLNQKKMPQRMSHCVRKMNLTTTTGLRPPAKDKEETLTLRCEQELSKICQELEEKSSIRECKSLSLDPSMPSLGTSVPFLGPSMPLLGPSTPLLGSPSSSSSTPLLGSLSSRLLLVGLCWCFSKWRGKPESRDKLETSSSEEEEDSEAKEDSNSNETFMPWPQQVIGVACVHEGWSKPRENILYSLLVPLRPPPRHTFHLELGNAEEMSARKCCVCMELECSCERERLVGDTLCFLHHTQDELSGKQEPSLLDSLCMGSYLHGEKTAHWFQSLVQAAWWHLPQSCDCCLMVLPSLSSCKIKLTTPCTKTFNIEMRLGVHLGDWDTFLSIE